MSQWTPCKRRDFIRRLRKLGFKGLYSGTRHQFMIYEQHRLAIPLMIREIEEIIEREITTQEWNKL